LGAFSVGRCRHRGKLAAARNGVDPPAQYTDCRDGVTVWSVDARGRSGVVSRLQATAAEQGWPPWQLTQAIHQAAGTPTLLMAWRLACGQSQAEVTAGIRGLAADKDSPCAPNPSTQQLSRWENGHETPGPFYRPLIGLWFRTTVDRLGFGSDDPIVTLEPKAVPAAVEEDDVERRRFLQVTATVPVLARLDDIRRRMDTGLRHTLPADEITRWNDIATTHIAAYGQRPPAQLLASLSPDLAELADLTAQYPRERDLSLTASQMCGLTGALHTDLEHDRAARDWLYTAARYAQMSGDTTQQYWVAMAQAMSAFYSPDPLRAVTIAGRTRASLGDGACPPAAQLAGLAARAYARAGRAAEARAGLQTAERLHGKAPADAGFFGFPERELLMYRSQVLTLTGDPAAWEAQTSALAAYPADDPMDRPLIRFDRARHQARSEDADAAAATAIQAITDLPASMRVPLLAAQACALAADIGQTAPATAKRYREELAPLIA
jgi:hypothetical protein